MSHFLCFKAHTQKHNFDKNIYLFTHPVTLTGKSLYLIIIILFLLLTIKSIENKLKELNYNYYINMYYLYLIFYRCRKFVIIVIKKLLLPFYNNNCLEMYSVVKDRKKINHTSLPTV